MSVDHDERRRRIAEVTTAVIAREGLEAATIRRIAAELGGPTKIVTYYFADKQKLLQFTWEHLAREFFEQVAAQKSTDIVGALMAMAAADDRSIARWRVYVAFWERAARDADFADLQRRHLDGALRLIGDIVLSLGVAPDEVDRTSLLLNALVQGISVQALADQQRWSAERIRGALSDQVEMLLGRPVPAV
jgi:TetR/AcrR family transcriptional repressor of bet genes